MIKESEWLPFHTMTAWGVANENTGISFTNIFYFQLQITGHWTSLMTFEFRKSGPVFCLLFGVTWDYAQPITGQVTKVTWPVIGLAQPELTLSKRQKTGPDFRPWTSMSIIPLMDQEVRINVPSVPLPWLYDRWQQSSCWLMAAGSSAFHLGLGITPTPDKWT